MGLLLRQLMGNVKGFLLVEFRRGEGKGAGRKMRDRRRIFRVHEHCSQHKARGGVRSDES